MIIIWGSGNYGKCDEVPGLCHVVTRFGHLYYIPLIPTQSFAVISEDGDGFRGAAIPMSFKSVLLGWGRAALLLGSIVGIVASIMSFTDPFMSPVIPVTATVVAIALLIMTYRVRAVGLASRARAMELASSLGLDDEGMKMVEEMYDAMETETPDDDFTYNADFSAKDDRFQSFED